MNVLIVMPWDQPAGGVASVAGNLARQLAHRGHRIRYFIGEGGGNRLEGRDTAWGYPGYTLYLRGPSGGINPFLDLVKFLLFLGPCLWQLCRLIRREQIDVINIHYPSEGSIHFAICRRLTGCRLVTSVHGSDLFPGGVPRPHYSWILQELLRVSDVVTAPSQALLSRSIGVLPFLESHGRVIHNGVDPAESNSAPAVNTGQAVARYILCTAAFNPIKAQDILLQAFARIQHLDPSLRVQLIGDGERREALQALASELGVVDRVEFLGWQDHESVLKHVGQCEVLVLPTRSEGLPIAVLEGMLAGKPVIATAVGGIPEQITDGEDGLLVPVDDPQALADALSRVLSDRQLAGRLGQAAMDKVHRCFTVERTADAYEGLFRELLTDRS